MRILLTGKDGQVGWELERELSAIGELIACNRTTLDLTSADGIVKAIRGTRPDIIVNAAAYTAVDKAESEPEAAHAVNCHAPGILAEEAKKLNALLVHYSTDYVFDGSKPGAYVESDAPNPLSVYGRTKHQGELAIQAVGCRYMILRTSWIYGPRGKNFLLTILRLAREKHELRVVNDQIGAPTTANAIARMTKQLLASSQGPDGLFHLSAAGSTSWHGFANAIVRGSGLGTPVLPISTSDYPTPARRPANSLMNNAKLERALGISMEEWQLGLKASLSALASSVR